MTRVLDQVADEVDQSPSEAPLDLRLLGQNLQALLNESSTEQQATERLAALTQRLTRSAAIIYFGQDSTNQLSATPDVQLPESIAESTLNKLYSLAILASQSGAVQIARTEQDTESVALAVPVLRLHRSTEVFVLIAEAGQDLQRRLAGLVQITQFVAAFAGQWRGRFDELRVASDQVHLEQFCQSIVEAESAGSLTATANRLADGLREAFDASLVAIGVCRAGGVVRLTGVSNQLQFDRTSDMAKCLEAVMSEAILSPADDEKNARITDSLRELKDSLQVRQIFRAPLTNSDGKTIGAYVFAMQRDEPPSATTVKTTERLLGHELDLIRRARRRPWQRLSRRFHTLTRQRKQMLLGLVALSCLGLFVFPVPHRVASKCEIQPITRRFIAAPYDGRLQAVFVKPGDWVEAKQVLARMDAREIRLESASVEADLVRAVKQRDTAMASRDTAAAQMAEFEMERLKLKLQMLQDRMDNLEIKSPTDGVVISGDPQKLEGSRLSMGQTLVEVGPLGQMVLEVAIPDEDVAYTKVGQRVDFRLESLPYSKFSGVVKRIHPKSEQRESENVFVADVQIDRSDESLRPGMRGRAKVHAEPKSLFWVLFHRSWEFALFRLGW